ncbi:MAG: S8 family serine peptidase [Gammaproteobacteria bacterium]|nr:S8 family serine peptidase [Gammaproteobacteria bacterium]
MRSIKTGLLIALFYLATVGFATAQGTANIMTPVFVELASPKPMVVARYEAAQRGEAFDEELHRASIRMAQDAFLNNLLIAGVGYNLSASELVSGVVKEHRFTDLINAVRIEALGWDMSLIRNTPNVKHISRDEVQQLHLNNSVRYIRANGPDSARTMNVRGEGEVLSDGSSTGQAIAILDTGLDHTNAMFDLRFDDSQFEMRGDLGGDTRAPRLSGTPYMDGTNHPKVAYRYNVNTAPVAGDDTGHGTNSGTTAGGLKVRTDLTTDEVILEGVAPGAVMMDYKVCPSLSCVSALSLLALEDCIQPVDDNGFPKPVCTVVNMSYGSEGGDPYSAGGIAAGNLQYAGTVPVASAGNEGPQENIVGSPSSTRTVISVAATNDPGVAPNSIDQFDDMDAIIGNFLAFFAPESNAAQGNISNAIQAQYVNVGFGDTAAHYAGVDAIGKICLSLRGSTVDGDAAGTGLFANKAAQCQNAGGIALLIYNNAPGQMGSVLAPSPLPVFTTSGEAGTALTAAVPEGGESTTDIRINVADSQLFEPATTGFSSRGPNNDYKVVKPDITAPGEDVLMGASKIGALGMPTGFTPASGTSFSGPHIAGVAALMRDANARPNLTPSQVRAAMMNTATRLRKAGGVEVDEDDRRNFIHETGAGLVEVVEALNVAAIMGTNELNGKGGPDDTTDPNFLPSYSFGERAWIDTGVVLDDTITVTMHNLQGGGGTYDLRVIDGGADRGDVTHPINAGGMTITLPASVNLVGTATFDVTVAIDGSAMTAPVGADVNGAEATEFLWHVVASNGSEEIRMPMYLRAVRGGAPVVDAVDDTATTAAETAVDIDVTANDSGANIAVTDVSDPANGTTEIVDADTIRYTPDPGFTGNDTFTYTISDGSDSDSATVVVSVGGGGQCVATGSYFTDFEADNGGFTVETASARVTSITWGRTEDPGASTPLSLSMMSDTNNSFDLIEPVKDDRLVSPTLLVSQDSELVFFHRFGFATGTDGGIDGGVLEINVEGGGWNDILAAGGSFNIGGYNGVMRADGNPGVINGREAWTGLSQFIDANTLATVDLSAFSGKEIQLRWRLTLDSTIVIGDIEGSKGWWIESVQVTNTGCDTPNLPPIARDDSADTTEGVAVTIDVLGNDEDPEGESLTVVAVTQPPNGSVTNNGDGTVTYTPDPMFAGVDTFSYSVEDESGNSSDATVTVTVEPDDNGGGGCLDDDSSSSDDDCSTDDKLKGSGWIPSGGEPMGDDDSSSDDNVKFNFNAHIKSKGIKGKLKLHDKRTDFKIYGDITHMEINYEAHSASFGGVCTKYETCTFEAYVEDNADPGRGADRFVIQVRDGATYDADDLLGKGNIKIK